MSDAFAVSSSNDLVCILRSLTASLETRAVRECTRMGAEVARPLLWFLSVRGRKGHRSQRVISYSAAVAMGRYKSINIEKCSPSAVGDSRNGQPTLWFTWS